MIVTLRMDVGISPFFVISLSRVKIAMYAVRMRLSRTIMKLALWEIFWGKSLPLHEFESGSTAIVNGKS